MKASAAELLLQQLTDHPDAAELAADQRAMLDYALKLNRRPYEISRQDVQQLRAAGFDDRAIHDICCIVAYYAFVNRVANGLGVELEAS